jgi:hypothetical protein
MFPILFVNNCQFKHISLISFRKKYKKTILNFDEEKGEFIDSILY